MRLINADALKKWLDDYYDCPKYHRQDIKDIVDQQTTVETTKKCINCGSLGFEEDIYCSMCGRKFH